jgi:deoxyribonuclease-4
MADRFLVGFHVSIAGGLPLAVERASELGCTAMQIFSHSPRSWALKDISPGEAAEFKKARKKARISPLFVHASYLINLASADGALLSRSIEALRTEMARAEMLGANYVVTHLGSASGSLPEEAVRRVAGALRETLEGLDTGVTLLLENTAGERGDVGSGFPDIARIMELSGLSGLGVTLDTCHAYGAGYDVRRKKGVEETLSIIDAAFGLSKVKLIHLNDSKHPLASRRDRHENIGMGEIGRAGFRLILNHPRLREIPFIMETPKASPDDDRRNMALVRKLRKN